MKNNVSYQILMFTFWNYRIVPKLIIKMWNYRYHIKIEIYLWAITEPRWNDGNEPGTTQSYLVFSFLVFEILRKFPSTSWYYKEIWVYLIINFCWMLYKRYIPLQPRNREQITENKKAMERVVYPQMQHLCLWAMCLLQIEKEHL